jgi:hypothetical protein
MKTDSNGLAIFLNATQGVKAHYHAPYAMPSLIAEAGVRAPRLKREAFGRTRNRIIAELAVVLIILAGCTIRIPASSSTVLSRFAPDINPNVWQALSIFALSGVKIDSQEELDYKLEIAAQEAYEAYGSKMSAIMLENKELPEDIRLSIGCGITDMHFGPDLKRARGRIGGIWDMGSQLTIDQAQFGWKFIRSEITSISGYPLNSYVKPFQQLCDSEKALLAPSFSYQVYLGDESKPHAGPFDYTGNLISAIAAYHSTRQITSSDLIKAWVGPSAYEAAEDASNAFTEEELSRWLAKNFLIQVASPITGKPFEPDHREFSRGNGFVTVITDKDDIAKLKSAVINAGMFIDNSAYAKVPEGYDWSALDNCTWCYYRIYGNKDVIAEGVVFCEWDGENGVEGYNLSHPSNRFIRSSFVLPNVMYNPDFWKPEKRAELHAAYEAANKPAPDYEEWLGSRTDNELAAIVWQLGYSPGGIFSTRATRQPSAETLYPPQNKRDFAILEWVDPAEVNGLPTHDLIPTQAQGEDSTYYRSVLFGDSAPLTWFAKTGVKRITTPEEWCKLAYSKAQRREIIRAYASGERGADKAKVKDFGPPYTTPDEELFLPIYRDFEPYQGYFERVDTPSLRGKAKAQLGREPKDMIYFRIYGAERVIAEGVWVR